MGAFFLAALLLIPGCSSKDGPTTPTDDDPVVPSDPPVTNTTSVGSSGGRVGLADGTAVVFPPGALGSTTQVTVTRKEASGFFDGSSATERVVVSADAGGAPFSQDVEIRVPLPAGMTEADSAHVLAGVIDDETGAVTVVHPSIRMVEGKPFLVVATRHFSDWIFEWLSGGKRPPASGGPLEIPYYNQGESGYCWATSLQMVTRAVKQDDAYTIPDIVGRMGIDEGGITSLQFRLSPTIASIVKDRTGVKPTRQTWDYVNANLMKEYIKREIGLNNRPVALFATLWNHAVVIVGYAGDDFILDDPASTRTGSVGYETRPWSAIGGAMGVLDNFVTLAVPAPLDASSGKVRVSFLPKALKILRPSSGGEPSAIYEWRWDHTRRGGHAFRHVTAGTPADTLPGESKTLQVAGDIQLSNASRSAPAEASVWVDITAVGAPAGEGRYSFQKTVSVPANAVVNVKPPDIPVDTFRYNQATPTDYWVTASVLVGGTKVDAQSYKFTLAPAVPELTAVEPATAMVGETIRIRGRKLGWTRFHNSITVGGVKAPDVASWSDDVITVKVPSGARTGEVVVTRGQVASNGLPFTLKEYVTSQSFDLTWGNASNSVLATATIRVNALSGGWKSVFTERSVFNPEQWVTLWFGSLAPPAGGSHQYEITVDVTDQKAAYAEGGSIAFERAYWTVRSQTPNGLPTSEVEGETLTLTEADSPYSKQAALHLVFRVTKGTSSFTLVNSDFQISFHPTHTGMRVDGARGP